MKLSASCVPIVYLMVASLVSLSACSGVPALIGEDIEVRNAKLEKTDNPQEGNLNVTGELIFSEGLSATSKYRDISQVVMIFTLEDSSGDNVKSIYVSPSEAFGMRSDIYSMSFPQEGVSAEAIPTDEWVNFEITGSISGAVLGESESINFEGLTRGSRAM